jgi:hypothetical protein
MSAPLDGTQLVGLRLITEIDMLEYLLFLVNRRNVAAEEEMRQ